MWSNVMRSFGVLVVLNMLITTLPTETRVTVQPFGKNWEGKPVDLYTLVEGKVEVRIMTYGATVVSLRVPDRDGESADVVLGYDTADQYVAKTPYFGAIVGRYANRLAHGQFQLDGQNYSIPKNDSVNSLHGGTRGLNKQIWTAKTVPDGVDFTYVSKDGDQGFPGTLTTTVRYTLRGSALRIEYSATTDKDTVLNLTNHSYFNLAGQGKGEVLGHVVKINAS